MGRFSYYLDKAFYIPRKTAKKATEKIDVKLKPANQCLMGVIISGVTLDSEPMKKS